MLHGSKLRWLAVLSLMACAVVCNVGWGQNDRDDFFPSKVQGDLQVGNSESIFRRASDAYNRRDWRQAVIDFGSYTDKFPNEPLAVEALFFRAESLIELGDHTSASNEFGRFLMVASADHEHRRRAEFRQGESLYLTGKLDQAKTQLTDFLNSHPGDSLLAYALPYLADIALQQGDPASALTLFERSIREFDSGPMSVTCRFGLARSAEELGQTAKARFAYSHLALNASHSEKALLHLGLLEYKIGNYDGAEKALSQLVDRETESEYAGVALYWRGMSRFARNDFGTAASDFRRSLNYRHPTDEVVANLHRYLGESLIGESKFQEAYNGLQEYVGDSYEGYKSSCSMTMAVAAANLSQFEQVDATYTRLHPIRKSLTQFDHWVLRLASAAVKHGEVDRARAFYKSVLLESDDVTLRKIASQELDALGPQKVDANDAIDEEFATLIEQRSFDEAEALLQRLEATENSPAKGKSDYRWYLMAAQYRTIGDNEGNVRCLMRIYEHYPKSVAWHESLYRLAFIEFKQKQYESALQRLAEFDSKEPSDKLAPHGLFLHGQTAAAARQFKLSEKKMSELVRRFPEHPLRDKAEYWVGEAQFRQEQYEAAETTLRNLANRLQDNNKPWTGMVPLRLAQIHAHRDEWRAALELARAISGDYPDFRQSFEVNYLIGRCRALLGQFDAAREAYRTVLSDPRSYGKETAAMAQWMIGETHMHQRNYDQAVSDYLRVETLHAWPEWQACGLYQAAQCYAAMKRRGPAIETYSRLMARFPASEYAAKSKAQIASLTSDKSNVRVADRDNKDSNRKSK
ncbi:MAG: tetratricopeptide repeat protein [Planctomycetota bacterium]